MEPKLYEQTWQAVGISSNPQQRIDPVSLHMLAYLMYGSQSSEEHLVFVDDCLQSINYQHLHKLDTLTAEELASRKGRKKQIDLETICHAYRLNNVEIHPISEWKMKAMPVYKALFELYNTNENLQQAIHALVPARFFERFPRVPVENVAEYALKEIALALTVGGIRISHHKQKQIDSLTQHIQQHHGIGKEVKFDYALGLEYEWGTKRAFEPYSGYASERRILLSDKLEKIEQLAQELEKPEARRSNSRLKRTWGVGIEYPRKFYERVMKKGNRALFWSDFQHIAKEVGNWTCIIALGAGYIAWQTQDAQHLLNNEDKRKAYVQAVEQSRYR